MKITTRTACPTDDLNRLWPNLGPMLNVEQVIVCVDDDDVILGGLVLWDGGHRMIYVGEFTIISTSQRRLIAKKLAAGLFKWCEAYGKTRLIYNTQDRAWTAMMLRYGATLVGVFTMMVMGVKEKGR
jgi:hypothetical protein